METFHAIVLFSIGYFIGFFAGIVLVIEIQHKKRIR